MPIIVISGFSGISAAQKLGSGRAEKSSEPRLPHLDHLQLTLSLGNRNHSHALQP